MKIKECLRLASLSLKNNKKQTSNTVLGFSLSLTLLIFVLFLVLSINEGIMKEANNIGAISSLKISYDDTNIDYPHISFNDEISNNQNVLENIVYSENTLYYTVLSINKIYYPTLTIDGQEYTYDLGKNSYNMNYSDTFSYYDVSDNKSIITKAEEDYLTNIENSKLLISGNLLSGKPNEIMISSMVVEYLNLDPNEIIGKSFSYSLIQRNKDLSYYTIDYKDLKIVGVFNQYLYNSPSRGEDFTSGSLYWLNEIDLSDDNVKTCGIVQFKNFNSFYSFYETLPYKQGINTNSFVNNYQEYRPLISLLLYTFTFFGSVVFIATLINLFNTARYNIAKRKSYLNMCKALGMTNKDIITMYSFENLIITVKSLKYSIPISFIFSLLIYILSMRVFPANDSFLSISFSLLYYPLAAIIIMIILGLISLIIARIACHTIIKKHSHENTCII